MKHVLKEVQISKRIPSPNNVYLLKGKVMLFFPNKKLNAIFLFCAIVLSFYQENEMALSEWFITCAKLGEWAIVNDKWLITCVTQWRTENGTFWDQTILDF